MAGRGKNSIQLNITAPKQIGEIIDQRRAGLRWTRSTYGLAIIEWWKAQGCPAVNAADQAMQLATATAKALPPKST